MELEHRFEVPAAIDVAWPHLLNMEKVAACFPGAALSSSDGDEYVGTVKVKLGPIQLTYAGAARIVAADEVTHTATIEASGNAARSGSTATMKVVASASAVDDSHTAVEMKTDLTITGRPAQFGRGVMVEVGNKILGLFADCLSRTLADAHAADSDGESATTTTSSEAVSATTTLSADEAAGNRFATGTTAAPRGADSIDLLSSARGSIVKRLIPMVAGLIMLCLWRRLRRSRSQSSAD